jgi:hypothetical protein
MATSHGKASRKTKKATTQHKARGRPRSSTIKRVHLVMPPAAADDGNGEDSEEVESGEDELYGRQVSDDDGIDDDAVIQKPQTHHKNRAEREEQPRGAQTKQLHSIPVINYYVHTVFEIVFMVPKNGTETRKRVPLLSTTDWHEVRSRLARAMGYDADEESGVAMTYRLSNTAKSTRDTLEDEDDYQGIIATLQARRANLTPLTVEIHDANVCHVSPSYHNGSSICTERYN